MSSQDKRAVVRAAERTHEIYAELAPLRAFANAIPVVGGPIDALLGGYGSKRTVHRMKQLLAELRRMIDQLDQTKLDKAFVESEEWGDLVMRGFEASSRTRDEKRIRLYAAILAGSASSASESVGSSLGPLSRCLQIWAAIESFWLLPEVHDCSAVLTGVRIGPGQEAAAAPAP